MRGRLTFLRRQWFRLFLGGLALFVLAEQALVRTGNPNFVPTVLLLGAFLVPVTLVAALYERAEARALPLGPVAGCFCWGGALGVVIAGVIEFRTLRDFGPLALLGVGLIEEGAKLVVPLALYLGGRYRAEADGVIFGVASGMGFAALETMGYGFVALLQSQGSVGMLEQTLLIRGLLAPVGHAAWSGVACAVLWRERERRRRPTVNGAVIGAFLAVVALHALWDLFNTLNAPNALAWLVLRLLSLLVAITSMTLLIRRLREADRA